jgi:hypothetical protein
LAHNVSITTADGSLKQTVSVSLRLVIAKASLTPPKLSAVLRPRSSAETSVAVTNVGNGPLIVATDSSVVDWEGIVWATVQLTGSVVLQPGEVTHIPVLLDSGGLPPSTYSSAIVLRSNAAPVSAVSPANVPLTTLSGASYSVDASLQVVLALLFPTALSSVASPGQPAVNATVSIINFAGVPILFSVAIPGAAQAWVSSMGGAKRLEQGDVTSFVVSTRFMEGRRRLSDSACGAPRAERNVIGVHAFNVSLDCYMVFDPVNVPNGTVVFTSGFVASRSPALAVALSPSLVYAPINISTVAVTVDAEIGAPHAGHSCVSLLSPSVLAPNEVVALSVSLRDAGGFAVACSEEAAGFVSVDFPASGGGGGRLESISPSANGSSCDVRLVPVLDGLTCVCKAGFYTDANGTCIRCPVGTYNPDIGRVGRGSCRQCDPGHYCTAGASTVSGKCPAHGFDCSNGQLRLMDGYWLPPDAVVHADGSVSATQCVYAAACVGADMTAINSSRGEPGCAPGYRDDYCSECDAGWAGLSGFCTKCYSPALASLGLMLLPLGVAVVVAFVVTISLEEKKGVHRVSFVVLIKFQRVCCRVVVLFECCIHADDAVVGVGPSRGCHRPPSNPV